MRCGWRRRFDDTAPSPDNTVSGTKEGRWKNQVASRCKVEATPPPGPTGHRYTCWKVQMVHEGGTSVLLWHRMHITWQGEQLEGLVTVVALGMILFVQEKHKFWSFLCPDAHAHGVVLNQEQVSRSERIRWRPAGNLIQPGVYPGVYPAARRPNETRGRFYGCVVYRGRVWKALTTSLIQEDSYILDKVLGPTTGTW